MEPDRPTQPATSGATAAADTLRPPGGVRLLYAMQVLGAWLWVQIKRFIYIVIRRGYVGVALGVYLVAKVLDRMIGSIPQMPDDMSDSLLIITVVISLFMYRQTLSVIRVRDLKQRDRLRALTLSEAAQGMGPASDTREAAQTHWRARKAMLWILLAYATLMLYIFGIKMFTRQAELSGEGGPRAVVFPPGFLRPQPVRDDLTMRSELSTEPIDDSMTYNAGLYAYTLPNEYPEVVYAIVLPLNVLFTVFCVMLTRSCGYAFAPATSLDLPPVVAAGAQVENKPGDVERKHLPTGSDMGVEAADMIEDMLGFL